MSSVECGRNCVMRGGPGYIVIPGGCASPDIPWRCPSADRCGHLDGMRERREREIETKREALFHWRRNRRTRHAQP